MAHGKTPRSVPQLPEPPAPKTPAQKVAMCGTEACPPPLPEAKMKLRGVAVVLEPNVRGPKSFAGILRRKGTDNARREFKLPAAYADVLASAKKDE